MYKKNKKIVKDIQPEILYKYFFTLNAMVEWLVGRLIGYVLIIFFIL